MQVPICYVTFIRLHQTNRIIHKWLWVFLFNAQYAIAVIRGLSIKYCRVMDADFVKWLLVKIEMYVIIMWLRELMFCMSQWLTFSVSCNERWRKSFKICNEGLVIQYILMQKCCLLYAYPYCPYYTFLGHHFHQAIRFSSAPCGMTSFTFSLSRAVNIVLKKWIITCQFCAPLLGVTIRATPHHREEELDPMQTVDWFPE